MVLGGSTRLDRANHVARHRIAYGTTGKHLNVGGTLEDTFQGASAVSSLSLSPNFAPSYGAFEGANSNGIRIFVVGTNWEVGQVWRLSDGETAGVELGDQVLSINGVNVPSVPATLAEVEEFNDDVLAARSGSTDDYYLKRSGVSSHYNVEWDSFWDQFRRASKRGDTEPDSSDPNAPVDACWICDHGLCVLDAGGSKQCFDGAVPTQQDPDPPCAIDLSCTCSMNTSFN